MTSRPRASVVVTGSELVRGERTDLNGPFLARELHALGVEPARIVLAGDAPDDLAHALDDAKAADLCAVSGGLGPTHDDRTAELVAAAAGVPMRVDEALEREIETVSRSVAERLRRPYAEFAPGVRKQATLPEGAVSLGLAGTAPGFVLAAGGTVFVVLPGPPRELQRLWPRALETRAVRAVLERARPPERRVLRLFGVSESAVAHALAEAGGDGEGVEATICARDYEIHVDLVAQPGAAARAAALEERLAGPLAGFVFSRDDRDVAEVVLSICRGRGLTLAAAESCTGGLVTARLTSVPGSSDVVVGGVVAYGNAVKRRELDVPEALLAEHGAVSAEVAAAMAAGVRERLRADVGVAVTGIAGPGGGTPEKPVGLVYLHAAAPEDELAASFSSPGDRDSIRRRATVHALHLVRRLLTQSRDSPA